MWVVCGVLCSILSMGRPVVKLDTFGVYVCMRACVRVRMSVRACVCVRARVHVCLCSSCHSTKVSVGNHPKHSVELILRHEALGVVHGAGEVEEDFVGQRGKHAQLVDGLIDDTRPLQTFLHRACAVCLCLGCW